MQTMVASLTPCAMGIPWFQSSKGQQACEADATTIQPYPPPRTHRVNTCPE